MKIKLLAIAAACFLLLNGCKKNDEPPVNLTEQFPQRVILVVDNDNDPAFYDYLTAPGYVVIRGEVEKKDDAVEKLYNSSHAFESVWVAHLDGNLLYFQLESDTSKYLRAVPNRDDNTQYLLTTGSKGYNKEHLFRAHHFDRKDGVKITAMESIAYPDHYFSHEGVVGYGNGVRLNKQAKPENAVRVRWYVRYFE